MNNPNKSRNTHWKNLFDYEYIGSHNLNEKEEIVCTIKDLKTEKVIGEKGRKEEKPIVYFVEDVPKMILNKTNAKTIAKLYTPYTDRWINKKIQLFSTEVDAFGKIQDAIRVRDFIPRVREEVDVDAALKKLGKAKDLEGLKTIWKSMSAAEREHDDVIGLKDSMKISLEEEVDL